MAASDDRDHQQMLEGGMDAGWRSARADLAGALGKLGGVDEVIAVYRAGDRQQ
ncbi:hypothetical protein [Plantactinospora sp. GCM10030261]|uniref:hypothetical protein n=1 Tax=Plantactinospora sp. GCM10030261 TaxID=3273420 RepID=UPI00360F8F0B